jgi:hypothetical protein
MLDEKVKARSEVLTVVLLRCKSSGTAELWRYRHCSPSEYLKLFVQQCSMTSQKTWIFVKIELWIREVVEGNIEIFLNIRKGTVLKFFHSNKIQLYFLDLTVKCCDLWWLHWAINLAFKRWTCGHVTSHYNCSVTDSLMHFGQKYITTSKKSLGRKETVILLQHSTFCICKSFFFLCVILKARKRIAAISRNDSVSVTYLFWY